MKQWSTQVKVAWADGPWQTEPDKMSWTDPKTDLPCLIVRGPSGALCGYVGVDDTHPYFGKPYEDLYDHTEVHGGLTFSDKCQESDDPSVHVCHVPEPGKPDNVWWFGFDCAHGGDLCPSSSLNIKEYTYKTVDYVMNYVVNLAGQLELLNGKAN